LGCGFEFSKPVTITQITSGLSQSGPSTLTQTQPTKPLHTY